MKKQLFTILIALISSFSFAQSIPNGGFESWNTITYEDPLFYQTSNLHGNNGAIGTVNALKTSDAFHGNYAIKLTTTLFGNDTSFAYFANGDPGKTPPVGGTPFNQTPTGIRFHYKSNIIVGDSALVLVNFKKNGALIGQYFWAINSTQSSYTLFNKNFSPALSVTPDTVVIGIASSFPFGGNRGIPGNMIQVDSVLFTGVMSQPANFNGDLESWQTITNSQIVGWNINGNNQGGNYQTTDKYSGTYALELQTQAPSFGGGGVYAATATTGQFTNNGPPKGGLPYNQQIDTLVFYYKYLPADPNDSANVNLSFKLNGINNYGLQKYLHTSGGYQMVQIPFNISGPAPDSLIINVASSSYSTYPMPNSYIGSDLKIDNMYFKSQKLPIAKFISPSSGCVGQPIQLTDNSANMASGWNWIIPGGTPSSSVLQNPQVTYSTVGTKTITLYATNAIGTTTNTSAAYTRTIAVYAVPSVVTTNTTICGGSSAILTASGAASYSWTSGQTTASISVTPTTSTNYTVTGMTNGCSSSAVASVIIPATTIPEICMVTTDSVFVNNIVFWDKTISNKVDSFIIYREVSTGTYKRIGAQHYSALSRFIDTTRNVGPANGDPNITSYRYKLQLRDSCGNYSALSPYHNCFYFTTVANGNFIWNSYEVEGQPATPVSTCNLLRDNLGTNTWTVVGSCAGTQTTINDPAFALFPNAVWRIDGLGFTCNPTYRTNQLLNKSKSNVKNNFNVGGLPTKITSYELNTTIGISPNPASSEITVTFNTLINTQTKIVILDVIGKIIYSTEINEGHHKTIPLNDLPAGVYFIKIQQDKNIITKKFIKE